MGKKHKLLYLQEAYSPGQNWILLVCPTCKQQTMYLVLGSIPINPTNASVHFGQFLIAQEEVNLEDLLVSMK